MPVGQWTTLTVRNEVKQRLQKVFENDRKKIKNQKFGSWLDNLLFGIVDYDEMIDRYGKLMEPIAFDDDHVVIMDHWRGKHFFVQISGEEKEALFCQEDKSHACMHVGFCLALPEVYKALIKKGFRPPMYHVKRKKWEGALDHAEGTVREQERARRKYRRAKGWSDEEIKGAEENTARQIDDIRNRVFESDA